MATIQKTVTVKKQPQEVFAYLTEADRLATWFPSKAETDPVEGGRYRFDFGDDERTGTFRAVEPASRLVYDWDFGQGKTEVEFNVAAADGGTDVRLEHRGFASKDDAYEMHDAGWEHFLQNLKSVAEDGVDRRQEQAG